MANKKITDYTEILAAGVDDFLDISVDLGGGVYDTRKIKASNIGGSSPLTTKGDLFTYDTDDARLPIGTDGQALIADSAEATGLRWGTVSADNMATADLTLTGDRTHNFNGNDLIFRTGASNKFRIWNGSGNIDNSLSFWDAGSGYMRTSFYTWTLSAGNATRDALRVHYNGVSSFGYNVRIGTNIVNVPSAKLHIHGSGSTNATTALLVENSSSTQLLKIDDDGGFALGLNASAFGYQATTIGNGTSTTADLSVAIGNAASSTSQGAIAIGHLSLANGSSSSPSIAIGQESDAAGFRSVALGWRSNASGSNSVAIGQSASSTGAGVAISGTASGGYIAIKGTASSPNSIALGGTASQSSAVSIGVNSTSSGYGSVALGYGAVATGNNCYIIRSGTSSTRTNATSNSMEVHFSQADATFRFGQSVDGWLNTTGSFGFGTITPSASAVVDLSSTTKGFLPPRMTTTEKNAISSPTAGLVVFDSTLAKLCIYTGSAWETITSA